MILPWATPLGWRFFYLMWGQKNLLVSPLAYWFLSSKPSSSGSSALASKVWNWISRNQTTVLLFIDVLPGELYLGFRLTLLKQANFKLITCWHILPCWILAGCFCKLWKINVKYADVSCLKQMFGPSCQNPINCSPWGLPPPLCPRAAWEHEGRSEQHFAGLWGRFWTWRSLLKRIKNRNIPIHKNQTVFGKRH